LILWGLLHFACVLSSTFRCRTDTLLWSFSFYSLLHVFSFYFIFCLINGLLHWWYTFNRDLSSFSVSCEGSTGILNCRRVPERDPQKMK
jgi:hypothetical protein